MAGVGLKFNGQSKTKCIDDINFSICILKLTNICYRNRLSSVLSYPIPIICIQITWHGASQDSRYTCVFYNQSACVSGDVTNQKAQLTNIADGFIADHLCGGSVIVSHWKLLWPVYQFFKPNWRSSSHLSLKLLTPTHAEGVSITFSITGCRWLSGGYHHFQISPWGDKECCLYTKAHGWKSTAATRFKSVRVTTNLDSLNPSVSRTDFFFYYYYFAWDMQN